MIQQLQFLKIRIENILLQIIEYFWSRRRKIAIWSFLFLIFWEKDVAWEIAVPGSSFQTSVKGSNATPSEFSIFTKSESVPVFINEKDLEKKNASKTTKEKVRSEKVNHKNTNLSPKDIWQSYPTIKIPTRRKEISYSLKKENARKDDNLANDFSNLTFIADDPNYTEAEKAAARKKIKQLKYVKRFANTAQTEMKKYGIPASITLAQGLLESNVGESRLARKNNNHFGIKCFSRKCSKGHCSNFTDDSHKDFFRKYGSAWESFRAHSRLLQAKRYQPLYQLDKKDYKAWAKGLKKAGYATDKKYAFKIIQLVEDLHLDQYDD